MSDRVLEFHFDYISHNAYLAWTRMEALCAQHDCTLQPVPVLFAGLLEAHHQRGPAEVPAKLRWMLANTLRKAALLGVPLNPPASHPFNPLLALRVSSLDMEPLTRLRLVDALFKATWAEGRDVTDPATVAAIAAACGLAGRDVLAEAGQAEAKARVRTQTEQAIAAGVFGVPSMRVDGQLFWGFDDLPYLELCLAGRDPLPPDYWQAWTGVRPSAQRRQTRE